MKIVYISHRKCGDKVSILTSFYCGKFVVACFQLSLYLYTWKGANDLVNENTVPWDFMKHYLSSFFWPRKIHVKHILVSFSPLNGLIIKVLPAWHPCCVDTKNPGSSNLSVVRDSWESVCIAITLSNHSWTTCNPHWHPASSLGACCFPLSWWFLWRYRVCDTGSSHAPLRVS